jgi:hypothetical protein
MRGNVWRCVFALGLLGGCSEDGAPGSGSSAIDAAIPDLIRQELVQLGSEDQEARQGLSPERMQDTAFALRMLRGDSARTARLQAIVTEHGWPDSVRAGREAAEAAFLILQHSPAHEFQRQMVPIIEALALEGIMPRGEAAMLIDRVLMHEGLRQRFGTQFTLVEGRWILHPVEDELRLNDLRESMHLPSMEEYMRVMEEVYGAPVVR